MIKGTSTRAIAAADANREFSRVLREVREGRSYVVTSHGKPVAQIIPAGRSASIGGAARSALFRRLEAARVVNAGSWTRGELYDRE
jgi:prevent-host-death family protein